MDIQDDLQSLGPSLVKIVQIFSSINTIREIDKLLQEILDAAVALIGAEAASIILKERDTGFFTIKAAIGEKSEQFKGIKIPVGKGIVGWTIQHNQSLLIADVAKDERFYSKSDKETGFQTRSIICVPLAIDSMVIGAIEVLNKKNGGHYDQRDEQILNMLGSQAAATIYNLMLYNEVEESKKRIERIINGMADGVILLDEQYRVTLTNPAARSIFGHEQEKEFSALNLLISEVKQKRASDTLDVVLLKPEGMVLSCKVTPLESTGGESEGVILALRNITEIKEKERRKSEILMLISHQLKDPFDALIAEQREKIAAMTDPVARVQELDLLSRMEFFAEQINKLIYYSHIDAGPFRIERRLQRFSPLIGEVVETVTEYLARNDIEIEVGILADAQIKYDRETLHETIRNLVVDAALRSPHGSIIRINSLDEDGFIQLEIQDQAEPVTGNARERIFDLERQIDVFMENDDELKDLNLTHAFARYVMLAHGGDITIDPGEKGNIVTIRLPKE